MSLVMLSSPGFTPNTQGSSVQFIKTPDIDKPVNEQIMWKPASNILEIR